MHIESDERVAYDLAMEARMARLEVAVEYMQRDIAELKAEMRAALMAKGFGWL